MNILTWRSGFENGAVQFETEFGYPYSDTITVKPVFSFGFNELYYNEDDLSGHRVDGKPMTKEQIDEVKLALTKLSPTLDWVKNITGSEALGYLQETAWYVERFNDPSSGKAIPENIINNRRKCREYLSSIKDCATMEEVKAIGGIEL